MPTELLDLDQTKNYPMLIEYDTGGQDIITCPHDVPNDCCFFIVQTNFILEGRVIIGSVQTRQ